MPSNLTLVRDWTPEAEWDAAAVMRLWTRRKVEAAMVALAERPWMGGASHVTMG